jgi:hypothetical protein
MLLASAPTPCADMRILGSAATATKVSSAALEEAQDRLQAQGRVDFALFNIRASLNL